jgi:Tfp pilus assembly PilM family ATPase/Tfp pilus assembly protein PilN
MRKKNQKSFRVHVHKKAVGIDVCKDSVSVVRLERYGDRITLTGCGRVTIGKEAGGNNENRDFKSFANAVIKSKLTGFPRHCEAGMCFCSSPELLQILSLPDSSPDAARKFIQEELRQYAVLPLKNVQIDYCALRSTSEKKSVLVGAAQTGPLTMVTKELEKNNVDIQLIEPAVVALVRACYNKVIKPAGNKNVMLVLLHDDNMSLCVFSGQKFDFLRTKKLDFDISSLPEQTGVIAEQIDSIVQFYELERTAKQEKWPVFLACSCDPSKTKEIVQQLQKHIRHQNIEITAIDSSHIDIICEDAANRDFSPVAAGAAMRLLDVNDSAVSINMLPEEIFEIRKSRRQLVIIANIAAVILLLIFIYMGFMAKKTSNVKNELSKKEQRMSNTDISKLLKTQADVNDRTVQITRNIDTLKTALKDKTWNNWAYILAEVSTKAPATVQIQEMRARDSSTVQIEGLAVNYNAVNDFVNRLNKCKTIGSAQLADAKQNTQYANNLIDYLITCSLKK